MVVSVWCNLRGKNSDMQDMLVVPSYEDKLAAEDAMQH